MPDSEIAVSVIVTARNAQKTLPRCLRALQGQTLRLYADMEVIVADRGSGDRTHETALEFRRENPDFFRVHRQTNEDLFCAQKTGLALARGQFIAFCGAGETVPPDTFRMLYDACEEYGSPYAGVGGARIWDPALRGILARRDFLLDHGLPVKTGGRAEQLAAYDTLR
ncbi:MAG: glycosyltransferase family 2 protein, partial [Firmicutes bacterium]|nr:glycosyltransferase family 2 protein [Bacillota bacterium]